ncbi:hypothetical protein FHT10_001735 [Xanthomonas arboricola]|nr:hypothetical protein [Xanthomonas cannabis]
MAQELKIAGAWRYQACHARAGLTHTTPPRVGVAVSCGGQPPGVVRVAGIVAVTRLALDGRQLLAIMAWEPTPRIRQPTRDRSPAT